MVTSYGRSKVAASCSIRHPHRLYGIIGGLIGNSRYMETCPYLYPHIDALSSIWVVVLFAVNRYIALKRSDGAPFRR